MIAMLMELFFGGLWHPFWERLHAKGWF